MQRHSLTRRQFVALLSSSLLARADDVAKERRLVFRVVEDGFDASPRDIEAVVRSAAQAIWQHCPNTKFEFGFRIYRNEKYPITHYEHEDGMIVIGLSTESTRWAQYSFQFAHEFCHALMGHANDWRRLWRSGKHANFWLEESLCEVGSLFALRAMSRGWETDPPYPNWRSYARHLSDYARKRLDEPGHQLPAGRAFRDWFAATEPEQRRKWTRDNNTIIARELLPIFEAEPSGWDALPSLNRARRKTDATLAEWLDEWSRNAGPRHQTFVARIRQTLLG